MNHLKQAALAATLLLCTLSTFAQFEFPPNNTTDGSLQADHVSFHDPRPYPYPRKTNDLELLTGFDLGWKMSKKFKLGLNYQTRLDQNISSFKASLTELDLRYNIHRKVAIKAAGRYSFVQENDWLHGWPVGIGSQQRLMVATYFKQKLNLSPTDAIKFQVRARMEKEWTKSPYMNAYAFFRLRLKTEVEASRYFTPYASLENFKEIHQKTNSLVLRFESGISWHLRARTAIQTFYRLERVNQSYFNQKIHVLGLVLNYDFPPAKCARKLPTAPAVE